MQTMSNFNSGRYNNYIIHKLCQVIFIYTNHHIEPTKKWPECTLTESKLRIIEIKFCNMYHFHTFCKCNDFKQNIKLNTCLKRETGAINNYLTCLFDHLPHWLDGYKKFLAVLHNYLSTLASRWFAAEPIAVFKIVT